jgi:hypothetical protein
MLIRLAIITPSALILCMLCACAQPGQKTTAALDLPNLSQIGVAGNVTVNGSSPASGAYVYAYRNMRSSLRGPADFEARVDEGGRYFLDLVEGDYYLVARMRLSGADAGPPKQGDAWALPARNPVTVNPIEITVVNFTLQGVAQPMLMREGTLTSGDTGFSGLLVDSDDKPLSGAFVIAYPNSDFQRMPEATSPSVGDDGRFKLYVERPGQWCLAARTRTRGQPIAGEPYGKLGKAESGCRMAVTGKIIDLGTIRLTPYRQ